MQPGPHLLHGGFRLTTSQEYIIQDILAVKEVSLFGGPSGASKTTLVWQIIVNWSAGESVFGHASYPLPYAYISVDRSERSVRRTLRRMEINTEAVPIMSAVDMSLTTLEGVLKAASGRFPGARVFFIDGFASLTPEGKINDYNTVAAFLASATRNCEKYNITIVGIVHAAKTRENEKYLNARQRILGSVAWAGFSDTIFYIEPTDAENATCGMRKFEILPRNAKNEVFELELTSNGTLIPSTRKVESDSEAAEYIASLAPESEFSFEDFLFATGASRSWAHKMVAKYAASGVVRKLRKGVYCKGWTS